MDAECNLNNDIHESAEGKYVGSCRREQLNSGTQQSATLDNAHQPWSLDCPG